MARLRYMEISTFSPFKKKIVSEYQYPFCYSEPLVHVFYYSTIISSKNCVFISIWDWGLNLGHKEYALGIAFVCPQSMSRIINHYNDSFLAQKSYFLGPTTKEIL